MDRGVCVPRSKPWLDLHHSVFVGIHLFPSPSSTYKTTLLSSSLLVLNTSPLPLLPDTSRFNQSHQPFFSIFHPLPPHMASNQPSVSPTSEELDAFATLQQHLFSAVHIAKTLANRWHLPISNDPSLLDTVSFDSYHPPFLLFLPTSCHHQPSTAKLTVSPSPSAFSHLVSHQTQHHPPHAYPPDERDRLEAGVDQHRTGRFITPITPPPPLPSSLFN